jgi:hypothetical protein
MAPSLPVSLMLKMFTLSSCDSSLTVALGLHLGKKIGPGNLNEILLEIYQLSNSPVKNWTSSTEFRALGVP